MIVFGGSFIGLMLLPVNSRDFFPRLGETAATDGILAMLGKTR
jgi:hypothetical protein